MCKVRLCTPRLRCHVLFRGKRLLLENKVNRWPKTLRPPPPQRSCCEVTMLTTAPAGSVCTVNKPPVWMLAYFLFIFILDRAQLTVFLFPVFNLSQDKVPPASLDAQISTSLTHSCKCFPKCCLNFLLPVHAPHSLCALFAVRRLCIVTHLL